MSDYSHPERWLRRHAFMLADHLREAHGGGPEDSDCIVCQDIYRIAQESADERVAFALQREHDLAEAHSIHRSQFVEVVLPNITGGDEHVRFASFPPGATVGQVWCLECSGSGWWGYGPTEDENGPCIECRGTGRVWVGLA